MAQAQKVQERMNQLRAELAARVFEGSAGGGMVRARASGDFRVLGVDIEAGAFETGDREMIQDLCAAAVNDALTRARSTAQEELQRASGGGLGAVFGGGSGPDP